jgi:hypothetical protein
MLLCNTRVLMAALLLSACSRSDAPPADPAAAPPPAEPPVVTVTTTDFAFDMPDTIPAGPLILRLVNNGTEPHHMQILRLDEGKTLADFAALPPDAPPPPWVVEVGGPNSPPPNGGQSETAVNLIMGNYLAVCFVPSPDGKPHIAKGMIKPFVVPPMTSTAALPTPDLTMTLSDYSFELSAPITAGRHVIRVVNQARQPHEVLLVKLAEGKTAQDIAAWVEKMDGPPPGEPVGGTAGLEQFMDNYVIHTFTPGEYALLCFIPDQKDGRPHVAHGMIKQVTVGA